MSQFLVDLQRENFSFQCAFVKLSSRGAMEITGRGLNLRVVISTQAGYSPDPYVYDFSVVKREVVRLCKKLSEKVLIASNSKEFTLSVSDNVIKVERNGIIFSLPEKEAVIIPVSRISPEELAKYLGGKLVEILGLKEMMKNGVQSLTLYVDNGEYSTGFEVKIPRERL